MPIRLLLQNSKFEPEIVSVMVEAFEDVCKALGLAKRDDPLREIVAEAIINCVKKGERDPAGIRECAHAAIRA